MKIHNLYRKGQAAMEFLMTYGWAILAAIIAIGVLAYFGVFNPSRLSNSVAVLPGPLNINSFTIDDGDALGYCATGDDCIDMEIFQNVGEPINVVSSEVKLTSGSVTLDKICIGNNPSQWVSGTVQLISFDCGPVDEWQKSSSIAGDITIKYTISGTNLPQVSTGNVRGVSQ